MWQKQMEETVCMARQVSSFSLIDGDGTSCVVMKLKTSNRGKWEIMTIGRCSRNLATTGVYLATQPAMDPRHALHEWASYASLRSKYGELFFFNPFFSKRASASPFLSFSRFGEFSPPKKRCLGPWLLWITAHLKKVIKAHFKSNQGPLKRWSNYQGHIDCLDGTRIERHTGRRPSERSFSCSSRIGAGRAQGYSNTSWWRKVSQICSVTEEQEQREQEECVVD